MPGGLQLTAISNLSRELSKDYSTLTAFVSNPPSINSLVPYIKMKDENSKGVCPFYDDENKICNIYFTLPSFCKTFPLYFNGEKYYVSDPSCTGIGQGEMTKEKLEILRFWQQIIPYNMIWIKKTGGETR